MKTISCYRDIQNIRVKRVPISQFILIWRSSQQSLYRDQIFLDVRSEKEFLSQRLPMFTSSPLLDNRQRNLIGTTYKQKGPLAAIQEGFKLSDLYLNQRLAAWKSLTNSKQVFIACWRGGLRSQVAAHYIQGFAKDCYQIEGGYKALRSLLLKQLEHLEKYQFYILAGRTGSQKTQLLNTISDVVDGVIDLEKLANHRGSAFGHHINQAQPSQSSFENALLFELLQNKSSCILLEDESHLIGHNLIPSLVKEKMKISPVIYLDADIETRSEYIFKEYVLTPLKQGISRQSLLEHALMGLKGIAKRLGGACFQSLEKWITQAFLQGIDQETHTKYIRKLLEIYYDKRYDYAFGKNKRNVLFRGDFKECKQWLITHLKPSN